MSIIPPNSADRRDVLFHLHSQTNPRLHARRGPLVMTRGEGIHVFDSQGKRYLEAMAGLWCTSLGFSEARLKRAAAEAYDRLGFYHTFSHKTPAVTIDLAEKLVALSPIPEAQAYFATSGSEATETMVKMAWIYHAARGETRRRKIIARDRGFHGSTIVAASMCGLPRMHREFGLPLPGFLHTLCPDPYRGPLPGEDMPRFVARLAAALEAMILEEGPDTIAAFIAEPINAAGGVIVPPEGYFPAIEAVLRRHGILVLADEVVCGFGRTGNMWGSQTVGMTPDMMAMAKGISSSYFPISAVLLGRPIQEAMAEMNKDGEIFGHGFTNSGHPVGAAIALETLRIYEEMDVVPHVRAMGERLRAGLRSIAGRSRIVGDVRGAGLMFAVELVADPATRAGFEPVGRIGARFDAEALNNGLIIRPMGDAIALCPPLIIDAGGVDELLERFDLSLRKVEAEAALETTAG
ncbi:aminotransferase [Teichococcus oryzae]|uniref:Aminotransferase class III-fold pyridoxal phosphate-dependent enzyme n=1 Tax=Teichococcus oryzae TaxID=1608942 RepID=A0A5B2TJ41_9PROT|nr:aminotransferase [Pseudoroseomonas oryzae]KAA2214005.1 aminotransferase class III-fold pyridoxal phosphate-dependent enzyme [Pseudoroseomonas oryzae]